MARKSKAEVKYTPRATNLDEKCKLCTHFYVVGAYDAGRCTQVEGEINSQGWCELFKRQS
jgi:High potential iron-sulfur protein